MIENLSNRTIASLVVAGCLMLCGGGLSIICYTEQKAIQKTQQVETAWSEYANCLKDATYALRGAELACWHLTDAQTYLECKIAEKKYNDLRKNCLEKQTALKQVSGNPNLVDKLL